VEGTFSYKSHSTFSTAHSKNVAMKHVAQSLPEIYPIAPWEQQREDRRTAKEKKGR